MHILHIIASLDPAQGGPPVVAENLAKAIAALGHSTRLAAEAVTSASHVRLPHIGLRDLWFGPRSELVQLTREADVLHLHGVWEPLLPAMARTARSVGRPYVVTPHGMLDPWSLAQKKWKKKLALALGYRRMLDSAGALHLLNEDERSLLAPLKLRSLGEVIPNGMFLEDVDPPADPRIFGSRQPGPGERPYILFLSRLHYKKGLDLLADAFAAIAAKYPHVDLVVAGPDGGEEQPFRQRIIQLGLEARTWLTGPLYGPEKWSALAGASVFCLPSRQEGFSVAILEAMACRVPVVVSENCHFPEVREVGAGRVVPLDSSSIAAALDAVLADPPGAKAMGEAGQRLVEQRFTWSKVATQMLALYERLLNQPPAR